MTRQKQTKINIKISLILLLFVGSCITCFSFLSLLPADPHGDEPHYLIMTVSMLQERDLNLADNYARRDFKAFTNMDVKPHRSSFKSESIYSHHLPGLPLLLIVPYWILGRLGTVIFLNILATLGIWQVYLWACALGFKHRSGVFAAVSAGLTLPWIMIGGMAYPAVPAGVCLITALRWFSTSSSGLKGILGCTLLCFLPWLHIKYAILSIGAFLFYLMYMRPGKRSFITSILIVFGISAAYFITQNLIYGDPLFLVKFQSSGFKNPIYGILGMFLDRETGLITYSPVFILSIFGFGLLRKHETHFLWIIGILAGYIAISGSWTYWHGGHAPPARYLVPLLPVMAIFTAVFTEKIRTAGGWILVSILLLLSLVNTALVLLTIPESVIVVGNGIHRLYSGLPEFCRYLTPSFLNPAPGNNWIITGWLCFWSGLGLIFTKRNVLSYTKSAKNIAGIGCIIAALFFIGMGVKSEQSYHYNCRRTPLSDQPVNMTSPKPGEIITDSMPTLTWDTVPGADGYIWFLRFPNGYEIKMETFHKTEIELPDSVLRVIPSGEYQWWVLPLKGKQRGKQSEKRRFIIR